jgi:hypothetical protein
MVNLYHRELIKGQPYQFLFLYIDTSLLVTDNRYGISLSVAHTLKPIHTAPPGLTVIPAVQGENRDGLPSTEVKMVLKEGKKLLLPN